MNRGCIQIIVCSTLCLTLLSACDVTPAPEPYSTNVIQGVLGANGSLEGFAKAKSDTPITFPADHGAHPSFKTEWWYVTGNLFDHKQRRFGYQLTFFRNAIASENTNVTTATTQTLSATTTSGWASNQVYMAHLAVTDVDKNVFANEERLSRQALDMSGSLNPPLKVWLKDWTLTEVVPNPSCDACLSLEIVAALNDYELRLNLQSVKPAVLQGQAGFSVKSQQTQSASHYYSLTRLKTSGVITRSNEQIQVQGSSWLDREWSTSSLATNQSGWDWFALQTPDGRELMIYQLRLSDGGLDPASAGVVVQTNGNVRRLKHSDFTATPTRHWRSAVTGSRYPIAWHLTIPDQQIDINITPVLDAQEHDGLFRYWEGAMDFNGVWGKQSVAGWGYVELTGY